MEVLKQFLVRVVVFLLVYTIAWFAYFKPEIVDPLGLNITYWGGFVLLLLVVAVASLDREY